MNPYRAPPAAPATTATGMATRGSALANCAPTTDAARPPIKNWPVAPMLKSPALKPSATDRPANRSGAVLTIDAVIAFSGWAAPMPKPPSSRARYARTGSPASNESPITTLEAIITTAPTMTASATAAIGMAESAQIRCNVERPISRDASVGVAGSAPGPLAGADGPASGSVIRPLAGRRSLPRRLRLGCPWPSTDRPFRGRPTVHPSRPRVNRGT